MQKRALYKIYKTRKKFLTKPFVTMRERMLLRRDTGIWVTKGPFEGRNVKNGLYIDIHFLALLASIA